MSNTIPVPIMVEVHRILWISDNEKYKVLVRCFEGDPSPLVDYWTKKANGKFGPILHKNLPKYVLAKIEEMKLEVTSAFKPDELIDPVDPIDLDETEVGGYVRKDVIHRISYYLKKVSERMSVHPSKKLPRAYTYRHERLMLYKKLMMKEIEKSRKYCHLVKRKKSFVIRGKFGMRFNSCEINKNGQEETYETYEDAELTVKQFKQSFPFETFEIFEVIR